MDRLNRLIQKAKHSRVYLYVLNWVLLRTVPFNKPHRIKVIHLGDNELTLEAGYIRANRNHINGIHACLLATLCEYASGLSLLLHFSPKEYRIILKNIQMTYHYQAKMAVHATFRLSAEQVQKEILQPLQQEESIFREFPVEVYDSANNHICTGLINWQIKAWSQVRSKDKTS